jgi:hypothetical protein
VLPSSRDRAGEATTSSRRTVLLVEFESGGTLAVFPESDTKFFSKPWPTQFEFSKNEHGEFTILKRNLDGGEEVGAKK